MNAPALPLNPIPSRPAPASRAVAGGSGDLTVAQRRVMIAVIVGAHVAGAWGLMQIGALREAVREAAPMFVDLIAPRAPVPPVPSVPKPEPLRKKPLPRTPVIAATPSPAPSPFVVPAPLSEVAVAAAPPQPMIVAAPAPPGPASAPPAPRTIPASAVQYLVEPAPEYPRLAARHGESGRVLVRVFIDEAGLPQQVQVAQSSGFARLDGAAVAAVQKARFRPPTVNGQPVAGWTHVPIDFGLEK